MSSQENKKSTLSKPVIWFFIFCILCVAAFLIVGLVKTCTAEHEENEEQKILQEEVAIITSPEVTNLIG